MTSEIADLLLDYQRDGFVFVPKLLDPADLVPLREALDAGGGSPGAFSVPDAAGSRQELSAWTELENDLIGVIPRLAPLVEIVSALVGEPVYHWHSKLSWKRPHTNAEWNWHQDYGFWAEEGVARPAMCTLAIAVGPVHRGNGCMNLVKGSHHGGRIELEEVGSTRCSSPAAVSELLQTHEVVPCELETGDAVVFHSNVLHSSGPNESSEQRTMLMSSYNAVSNPPSEKVPDHAFAELEVLPEHAIRDGWDSVFGRTPFLDPVASGLSYQYDLKVEPR